MFFLLLLAIACGTSPAADCEPILLNPSRVIDTGAPYDCADGTDYSGCCPDGYAPIGFDQSGNLVCWCE